MATQLNYQNNAAARRERPGLGGLMFGLPATELLQLLASEVGGWYEVGKLFEGEHIDVTVGRWLFTVDYTIPAKSLSTRVRCIYVSPDGFRLCGRRNDLIHRWLRFPRWPTLQTEVPLIDQSLLIEGNDATKLQAVFSDPHLRACLSAQPPGWVDFGIWPRRTKHHSTENLLQLQVVLDTQVKQAGHLIQLLQFSAVLLDRLASVGSAEPYTTPPSKAVAKQAQK